MPLPLPPLFRVPRITPPAMGRTQCFECALFGVRRGLNHEIWIRCAGRQQHHHAVTRTSMHCLVRGVRLDSNHSRAGS
jgi:hypothetical protein